MNKLRHLVYGTASNPSFSEQSLRSFLSEREVRSRVRFTQRIQEMGKLFLCALLCILLFATSRDFDRGKPASIASVSNKYAESSLDRQTRKLSTTTPVSDSALGPVRELIERWCTAYGDLNEKELAALESPDFEIVDRFGELHVSKQRPDQERFWAEGFEMIGRDAFHPEYVIQQIRSIRPDVAVVHVEISYPGGIPLKDGDFIPAFSELHTFIVSRDEVVWRIAGHTITMRGLR
jgi:hypothetical protein